MTPAALTCPHCAAPLGPLQRQAGHCGTAACRHRAGQARWATLAHQHGEPALQAAAPHLQGRRAALLWLRDAETRLVPVPKAVRAAHHAHLTALLETPPDETPPLAEAAPSTELGEQPGRLCGQCGGRCCAQGGPTHAFITRPQLQRWQLREAGRTLQDAVDWYMAQIPPRHTRLACVYQGPQGCVLPRGDRADICNSYACDPLVQVQQDMQEHREADFVAVTLNGDTVVRRALITGSSTQHL